MNIENHSQMRIGQAIDAHRFATRKDPGWEGPLNLCCLQWPNTPALLGHSDGDVAAHALCDALLLAAGLGDLGTNFGVDNPKWAGTSGEDFLVHVREMLQKEGWYLENATVQVIGNKPRMAPRYAQACARLSEILGATVNVSATTTDSMGWTGTGEGLAASACVLIRKQNS